MKLVLHGITHKDSQIIARERGIGHRIMIEIKVKGDARRLYYHPTPNPVKVALLLGGDGLAYETVPVDTSRGEQHTPAFRGHQSERQSAGDR